MTKTKTCSECRQEKPTTEYHRNKSKRDGLQSMCKRCRKSYTKQHYEANKQSYVDRSKTQTKRYKEWYLSLKSGPCADCGKNYHPCQLDFDHIGSDKQFNIGDAIRKGFGKDRILAEIEKCELVCANCHRLRTYKRLNGIW
jgi:hypothetical protein